MTRTWATLRAWRGSFSRDAMRSGTGMEIPEEGREQVPEGHQVLAVVIDDGNERPAVAGPEEGLVELRDEAPRDIDPPGYPEDVALEGREPAVGELPPPSAPGEVEEVEVGPVQPDGHPVVGRPLADIGDVEALPVEGNVGRPFAREVLQGGIQGGGLLRDLPDEVLARRESGAREPSDADEDDGTGEDPQGLDVEEDQLVPAVEAAGGEGEGVRAGKPPGDPSREGNGLCPIEHREELPGARPEPPVIPQVEDGTAPPAPEPFFGHRPDPFQEPELPEEALRHPVPVGVEVRDLCPGLDAPCGAETGLHLPPREHLPDRSSLVEGCHAPQELEGPPVLGGEDVGIEEGGTKDLPVLHHLVARDRVHGRPPPLRHAMEGLEHHGGVVTGSFSVSRRGVKVCPRSPPVTEGHSWRNAPHSRRTSPTETMSPWTIFPYSRFLQGMVERSQPAFFAVAKTSMPAASMLGRTRSMCRHRRRMDSSTTPGCSSATQCSQKMQG